MQPPTCAPTTDKSASAMNAPSDPSDRRSEQLIYVVMLVGLLCISPCFVCYWCRSRISDWSVLPKPEIRQQPRTIRYSPQVWSKFSSTDASDGDHQVVHTQQRRLKQYRDAQAHVRKNAKIVQKRRSDAVQLSGNPGEAYLVSDGGPALVKCFSVVSTKSSASCTADVTQLEPQIADYSYPTLLTSRAGTTRAEPDSSCSSKKSISRHRAYATRRVARSCGNVSFPRPTVANTGKRSRIGKKSVAVSRDVVVGTLDLDINTSPPP